MIGVLVAAGFFCPILFIAIPVVLIIGWPLAALFDRCVAIFKRLWPSSSRPQIPWENVFGIAVGTIVLSPFLALIVWLAHWHITFVD